MTRTEETGSGASWINSSRTTYQYDGMNRQDYEKREDWLSNPDPDWVQTYEITQEYDKKGNRTRLDRNVPIDYKEDYGLSMDLGYTYNTVNALTAISDADDANYECIVTCDANNNITLVAEAVSSGSTASLMTMFTYDWANRMETATVSRYLETSKDMVYTKREHEYDAAGRLVNSTYKNWLGGEEEPSGDTVEHCYAGSKHVQNTDGSSSYGSTWHWAGAANSFNAPVKSPNADTASQDAYNLANAKTPQRRTWQSPTSAGDERNLYGQGKPMAKDSSGGGLDWSEGITSDIPDATVLTLESRLDFDGTVAPTDLSRATDAREKGRIGIFGSQLSYAGSSGRVTSEPLGRDLNPLGRGDGGAYVAGAVNLGVISPRLPGSRGSIGSGFSVNNCGQCGGGGGGNPDNSGSDDKYPNYFLDIISGSNWVDYDCYEDWKANHDFEESCPSLNSLNCSCESPSHKEWRDNAKQALDDYCGCYVKQHCMVFPTNSSGLCSPPPLCIHCGSGGGGNGKKCPDNCEKDKDNLTGGDKNCERIKEIFNFMDLLVDPRPHVSDLMGSPSDPCSYCYSNGAPNRKAIESYHGICDQLCRLDFIEGGASVIGHLGIISEAICEQCCLLLFEAIYIFAVTDDCCPKCC